MSAPRLVLYGHFGGGNLGNDSSLEAALYNIRKHQPSATVTCVCSGPQVIAERFGIETLPIGVADLDGEHQPTNRVVRKAKRVLTRIADQIGFWFGRVRWFRNVDQFIVVGTGAVDDMADRPWRGPYDLFRWCAAAKLAGAKVVFLSVGAGPIENRVSRALMLQALRVADYRSYRDAASVEYLKSVGFDTTHDSVYPDLVFSLPEQARSSVYKSATSPQTVGLGVISYYGWRHDQRAGEPIYQDYMAKLKRFAGWLLDQGYTVRLLSGDHTDQRPLEELYDFVRTQGQAEWRSRIFAETIGNVNDLFEEIAKTDIVVASRFHNVLCALMLGRPAVSIGYHKKNDLLLAEMGLESYCQHIEQFSVDRLIQQFQSLASEMSKTPERIHATCAQYRQMLDEQYCRILCPGTDAPGR